MSRRRAFTLVELLVVIGIIAVLVGILIPVLTKARESAQKTACLSNLRECANAFRIYAATFKDACPIGYLGDLKQFSYVMNDNNGTSFRVCTSLGTLALAGLAKNGRVFYCPSEQDKLFMYDSDQNVWCFDQPVGSNGYNHLNGFPGADPGYNNAHTRAGYNSRPCQNFRNSGPKPWLIPRIDPCRDYGSSGSSVVGTGDKYGFIRLAQLKNKAIMGDLVNYGPQSVRVRHKKGINCLYANGSAQWVQYKAFDKSPWNTIPPGIGVDINSTSATYNLSVLDEEIRGGHPDPTGLWVDLDRQSS